jgi:ABC-2 type transport system ATP-binding protein
MHPNIPGAGGSVIEVKNLRKAFGEVVAVDSLSFTVAEGEIYGLLGPNGAGKTTTISMICGLLVPDSGIVRVAGMDVRAEPGRVKALMGYVPQEIALYEELSALENVGFWGRLYGLSGKDLDRRAREVLTRVGLWDRAKEAVKKYSGGMKRRVNLAAALLHEPKLLLLDEPTVGIDPQARLNILDVIREVAAAGTTILYTTHYMDEAEHLCHRIGIMDHGRLLAEGTLAELVSLVGEGRVITLGGKFEAGQLEASLRDRPDVRVITLENGRAIFVARNHDTPAALVKTLFERGVPVEDISVKDPSLESLFIKLTGKELRD